MPKLLFRIPTHGRVLVCLLLTALAGCGSQGDRPEIGQVRGKVVQAGTPLAGAIVTFSPDSGGRTSQAMTDDNGVYDLIYMGQDKGAKIGTHKVRITTAYEGLDPKTGQTVEKKEVVPKRYNSTETELTADVKPGPNEVDFQLEAK
ncbi:MAG: carboxypeptidase-like regulatory domain-containing protein [Planctomycetaceae bacterium]|nr:carboxypeptidase-like regulatory domain-containing protein [Planctomycetaceae bacterium]